MITQTEKKYYTREEYFVLEETAEYKSEYHDGEIIPMTGGTTNHNKIVGNFYSKFLITINNQEYEIYMNDVRLSVPDYNLYTYPDVMIIKGKPNYTNKSKTTVTNPQVIVEVLSKSTQDYDRTEKFKMYRSLLSLNEYIMINQYRYSVEKYVKQTEEQWFYSYFDGEEAILTLSSLEFQIPFNELYSRVEFEESDEIEPEQD
ncbi:Uma2 family endonuclease [Chroococcus sp. FPU101]|uniref:Uma2 family endonuclease n=1 Tax=Chroococcus sp. FPU101 TaxID=1974212 RepID=UPI001A8EA075|nr:Uma2 family endonuclease [Chroococcus sp. FPU101]GFE68776.1 hypothetical protein CFPU101_13860 [Chroococcus sp. FPU101]